MRRDVAEVCRLNGRRRFGDPALADEDGDEALGGHPSRHHLGVPPRLDGKDLGFIPASERTQRFDLDDPQEGGQLTGSSCARRAHNAALSCLNRPRKGSLPQGKVRLSEHEMAREVVEVTVPLGRDLYCLRQ